MLKILIECQISQETADITGPFWMIPGFSSSRYELFYHLRRGRGDLGFTATSRYLLFFKFNNFRLSAEIGQKEEGVSICFFGLKTEVGVKTDFILFFHVQSECFTPFFSLSLFSRLTCHFS